MIVMKVIKKPQIQKIQEEEKKNLNVIITDLNTEN